MINAMNMIVRYAEDRSSTSVYANSTGIHRVILTQRILEYRFTPQRSHIRSPSSPLKLLTTKAREWLPWTQRGSKVAIVVAMDNRAVASGARLIAMDLKADARGTKVVCMDLKAAALGSRVVEMGLKVVFRELEVEF